MIFHCRFMSLTSMQADSFTANLSWNFKLQLVFLNRLHAFSTWHLRFNPVFSFQMWHSNIMFILQLSEWDEENVILTGSIDGVVRVSIILVFLLFMFFINFLLNFSFQWQIFLAQIFTSVVFADVGDRILRRGGENPPKYEISISENWRNSVKELGTKR